MSELKDLTVREIAEQMAFYLAVIQQAKAKNEEIVQHLKEIAHGQETT